MEFQPYLNKFAIECKFHHYLNNGGKKLIRATYKCPRSRSELQVGA